MFWTPLLIGAGVGALGGLLTGNDPLKTAALGAAVGGTGGAAGAWGGGQAAAAGTTTGLGTGGYAAGANPAAFLAPTGQEIGMANAFNMATNAPTGLATQTFGAQNAMLSNPIMGGLNPLSDAQYSQIASTPASESTSLWDDIKPYANVQNLSGAANIYDRFNQRPQMPTAPSGGISRGQAPQGTDVMALLASVKPREQRRISLL